VRAREEGELLIAAKESRRANYSHWQIRFSCAVQRALFIVFLLPLPSLALNEFFQAFNAGQMGCHVFINYFSNSKESGVDCVRR
jgi:hypothetical protein